MMPPHGSPEGLITALTDRDVDDMLRRVEDLYLFLCAGFAVNRRFEVRQSPRRTPDNILSMRYRQPQSKGPDERGRS